VLCVRLHSPDRAEKGDGDMFERFTDQARRVLILAQEEARMLDHNHIGPEHILLGLTLEDAGPAARSLEALGIGLDVVRRQVKEIIGRGQEPPRSGHVPFTPRAKKTLELTMREAMQLGSNHIAPEHILLGLIRLGEGPAAEVLIRLGATLDAVRQQLLGQQETEPPAPQPGPAGGAKRKQLAEILERLDTMESRLSALERRVGTGPDVSDLDRQIRGVRQDKEQAVSAQEFEAAATLRDRERELLAEIDSRQEEWASTHRDLPSLSDEVEVLRDLLRQHGIEPHGGAA
jgi:Clp amino terminal domain, pathogenicity island component/UvrB/uvrC motif